MTAILQKVEDPRDSLDRARQFELYAYAQRHGISEIVKTMPAILMRRILRSKGLTNVPIPPRTLGKADVQTIAPETDANSVDAAADLARQFKEAKVVPIEQMTRAQLAKTCKARGIKMQRTDTKEMLQEKLRGKDAA